MARGKKPKQPSQGLGDTIEKITTATGIKAVVKFIAGEDCGCDERKERLNKLFPYKSANCLLEDEYEFLSDFLSKEIYEIRPSEQTKLLTIYNRVFNLKYQPSTCSDCWRDIVASLKKLIETYKNED